MELSEQAHAISVALGKSENMKVTAGRMYAEAWSYVTTPGTDGAQQLSDIGLPIKQISLWTLIVKDPAYPSELGTSFTTGKRVLAIGRSPDPVQAAQKKKADTSEYDAGRRDRARNTDDTTPLHYGSDSDPKCNSQPSSEPPQSTPNTTEASPKIDDDEEADPLAIAIGAAKLLDADDLASFASWFRAYIEGLS